MAEDTIAHTHSTRRRTVGSISSEYKKLWDKVWWNRHMSRCPADLPNNCTEDGLGCDSARVLIDRYGADYLDPGDDIEWGICLGKMMALAWVLGSDWEGSGDT